jgi:hypothetical protein
LRTLKGAAIRFGTTSLDCIVRNMSEGGAALEIASPIGIPDEFALYFKPDMVKRNCHVTWRKAERIGVRFV